MNYTYMKFDYINFDYINSSTNFTYEKWISRPRILSNSSLASINNSADLAWFLPPIYPIRKRDRI